jgi:hypothetical protein
LCVLAERFVSLTAELADVRNAMRKALANGAEQSPRPTVARRKAGKAHPNAAKAKGAENAISALVRSQPMKPAAIAQATQAKISTTRAAAAPAGEGRHRAEPAGLAGDVEPVTPEELDLVDGRPLPFGSYPPWIVPPTIPDRPRFRRNAGVEGFEDESQEI